ncbi:membrane protein insertase YidC [Campylobacter sp. 19-13652]|uniref:membrane protein insertase YidC n=1 Tax=Campylobacter sp. 19-13652 TaxID=2840180 RepID=UPI001C74427F|nr:membrane protein insertase YidC [Campylobacter sp. 19-13652]BCX79165.1 membrane protein insertase YidC [Campylobacter sp. 19-13652]
MQNLSTQKRVLLATLLSFIFFIAYDYFFIPKQPLQEQNAKNVSQSTTSNLNTVEQGSSNAPALQSSSPVKPSDDSLNKIIAVVKSASYEIHIDALGRISKYYIEDSRYNDENGQRLQLLSLSPLPLELRFSDSAINDEAFKIPYTSSASSVEVGSEAAEITLTQELNGLNIVKKIKFNPNGSYDVSVLPSRDVEYFMTPGLRPNIAVDNYTVHGVLLQNSDESLEILSDDSVKSPEVFNNINILADSDRYYTTLFYSFNSPLNVVVDNDKSKDLNSIAFIKANGALSVGGYIGPKGHKELNGINPQLTNVIEYGWFTFIAKPMFKFIDFLYNHIGNWGWAIVVLTLIIRLVLFPLTYKGMLSMNKLKELAPKVKELQAKYKGDPQKLNVHMMELYKKHGANPMGGCLPIIIQIPIFFAIYRVLLNAIELKSAPWILWIHDLSAMDPYYVLPILMGATMFLQQKLTPTTFTDPMQEKIIKFLPLIFTFFFVNFPAGLTLYWFVNNVCSVIQQIFVNKLFAKHKSSGAK